jgi:hypothetical protein
MLIAIGLAVLTVRVADQKTPNALAAGLLQAITLVFTVYATVVLARRSPEEEEADARTRVRPHVLLAFRRVLNLYRAVGRQARAIDDRLAHLDSLRDPSNPDYILFEYVNISFLALGGLVVEHLSTAGDSVSDWRDLLPDWREVVAAENSVNELNGEMNRA